ncbi:uncharacterized protein LOC110821184 isoform X10 [Carica papaya]|uniref:uncharacterized protein LOC110821184 isoform X10 n=1 Tax=Carica papaya TaxID=3649 RepID=UPI000B8CB6CD|nr:uncharacterized protein LOC110821184 isoform X10 [Carica papaya]
MQGDEARVLLGFPPNSRPTLSQVKAAYKSKVWESHPDLFPAYEKPLADSKFKLISEAYACLLSAWSFASVHQDICTWERNSSVSNGPIYLF